MITGIAPKKEAVWSSVLPLTHLEKIEKKIEKKFPVVLKQQSKTLCDKGLVVNDTAQKNLVGAFLNNWSSWGTSERNCSLKQHYVV